MAEIKSTMDMVLERAARMAAGATDTSSDEELEKKGMRLAADFLRGEGEELSGVIAAQPDAERKAISRGIIKTLLRNVTLPRNEQLKEAGKLALQGVGAVVGSDREVAAVCQELGQLLDQYAQHKEQMTQQLEDAIRGQLQQQGGAGRGAGGGREKLNPALHPQYHEELNRMLTGLNGQYNEAFEQRRNIILEFFGISTGR